jgi:hypothetical protein
VITRLATRMHDDKPQVIRCNTCLEQRKILGNSIGFAITPALDCLERAPPIALPDSLNLKVDVAIDMSENC